MRRARQRVGPVENEGDGSVLRHRGKDGAGHRVACIGRGDRVTHPTIIASLCLPLCKFTKWTEGKADTVEKVLHGRVFHTGACSKALPDPLHRVWLLKHLWHYTFTIDHVQIHEKC
eukprot:203186-Chlamydomonas_euryale.AAC.1